MLTHFKALLRHGNGFAAPPADRCTWSAVLAGVADCIIMAALTVVFALATLAAGL